MKHEHKVGIKAFQHNVYANLQKIDDNTDLIITNRGQEMYTVTAALGTGNPTPPVVSSTLEFLPKKKRGKHEDHR